ncbi:MAG: hypothetical protein LBT70_00355 [Holosporaceae bacterium]|nr:hypothetical protein [Holosporaceae bacterium]
MPKRWSTFFVKPDKTLYGPPAGVTSAPANVTLDPIVFACQNARTSTARKSH